MLTSAFFGITDGPSVKFNAVFVYVWHYVRRVFCQSCEEPNKVRSVAVEVGEGRAYGVLGGCAARAVVQGGQRRDQRLSRRS